jgi:hypothetical protein
MSHAISERKELYLLENEVSSYISKLDNHPVYQNDYFKLLENTKWSKETYALHRANFFYRTELTVKGIAHICSRAAVENDQATLILFAYILNEETGNGDPQLCHEKLMEQSHNLYAKSEFSLPELLVNEAKESELIIEETLQYRDRVNELITASYPRMLGVAMALESHADHMLHKFRGAFRKNLKKLDNNIFEKNIEIYFNCHIDNGVEERHAEDARRCVINNCKTNQDLSEIIFGAEEMLKAQTNMWNALAKKSKQITL